jgi:uncharacterized protein (DUF1330 family)
MTLYSLKGSKPEPLPFRLKFPDGFTRTDPSTFTADEISAAGYSGPYEYPTYDSKTETVEWTGTEFIVRPYNTQELEDQWDKVREQRNQLLKDSDWTQISDYDLGLENKEQWALYRQELRDLPEVQSNPFDIQWSVLPSA